MDRLKELREWLPDARSGAVVTSAVSRSYLLGFAKGEGTLVISKEQSVLYVGAEVYEQAKSAVCCCKVVLATNLRSQLLELMLNLNVSRVYIEPERMTVREYAALADCMHFGELLTDGALSEKLAQMRAVKTDEELALIRKAQGISDAAYRRFLGDIRKGMTEKQAAGMLSSYLLESGADALAFPVSAASGENTALGFPQVTDRALSSGDLLVVRFGAVCGGYCSSCARTIAVGDISEVMEDVYNAVVSASADAVNVLGAGRGCKLPYSVAKSTLNSWGGLDERFPETLGHGVGMEPQEAPVISAESRGVLREGMVVTVAPSVRVSGKFGVSLEDMAVITENGCNLLSNATKKLIHI